MRLAFVALTVGAALVSSALLLTGAWGEAGPPTAAAFVAEPLPTATETPAPSPTATATLEPTATSTSTPTETPVPPILAPADSPQLQESVSTPIPPAPADPPAPVDPPPPASCPSAPLTGYAAALFNAINSERAANGMFGLGADGCAVYVAQLRSDDMASVGYFSHTSPSGQSTFSLLDVYGVPRGWAGENLARNNYPDGETVAVAIRDLMASASHRENILSANYTTLGVAVAFDGAGMKYFTMVFLGPP